MEYNVTSSFRLHLKFFVLDASAVASRSYSLVVISYVIEAAAMATFAVVAAPLLISLLTQVATLHRHSIMIIAAYTVAMLATLPAFVIMILFTSGILTLSAHLPADALFVVAGVVRFYHIFACITFLVAMIVERAAAVWLVASYEKHAPAHISAVLIMAAFVAPIPAVLALTFGFLTERTATFLVGLTGGGAFIGIIVLELRTSASLKRVSAISQNATYRDYTLPLKYQMLENHRMVRFFFRCAIGASGLFSISLPASLLREFVWPDCDFAAVFLRAIIDFCQLVSSYIPIACGVLMLPDWRNGFLAYCSLLSRFRSVKQSALEGVTPDVQRTTDVYFVQLSAAWNAELPAAGAGARASAVSSIRWPRWRS